MRKHFYSHLINIDSLITSLSDLGLQGNKKNLLISIINDNVHHVVIETIFDFLVDEDREIVIMHIESENHDAIWILLNEKINQPEQKIIKAIADLKKELHDDINSLIETV